MLIEKYIKSRTHGTFLKNCVDDRTRMHFINRAQMFIILLSIEKLKKC